MSTLVRATSRRWTLTNISTAALTHLEYESKSPIKSVADATHTRPKLAGARLQMPSSGSNLGLEGHQAVDVG